MEQISFADIFNAAPNFLRNVNAGWNPNAARDDEGRRMESAYSCDAVTYAMVSLGCGGLGMRRAVSSFLRECGVDTECTYQFEELDSFTERYEARLLWLCMLHTVAEDEGL